MPVNESMMRAFKKRYGSERGERIFFARENKLRKQARKGSKSAAKQLAAMTKGGK